MTERTQESVPALGLLADEIAPFAEPPHTEARPSDARRPSETGHSHADGPLDFAGVFDPTRRASFEGPSSAPPTPSVISITHPPQFIHTHHPRRGSLTPLGLNVISPMPPKDVQNTMESASIGGSRTGSIAGSPRRNVGFFAQGAEFTAEPGRRDSVASVSSNLTASRPTYGHVTNRRSSLTSSLNNVAPPSGNALASATHSVARRRSSLTPSVPSVASPSPTRALATGRIFNRVGQDSLSIPFTPTHSRTIDSIPAPRRASIQAGSDDVRRGSLPHLYYGAWTAGKDSVSPSAPAPPVINQSFKFGSGPPAPASRSADPSGDDRPSSAASSLQRIADLSLLSKQTDVRSAFQLTEEEEAERQRRAFLAATYGEDSRRARARLSLGGQTVTSPASPAGTRRTSLLVWERVHRTTESLSSPALSPSLGDLDTRRPSLPINIPTVSSLEFHGDPAQSFDDAGELIPGDHDLIVDPDATPPSRPLPPLLPLSDPVPRLLPSTLALHRANHLLNSRNLESEPLPAPLPPTLHPPQPVDLSEFDIDFILAGSNSQLGRAGSTGSRRTNNGDGPTRLRPSMEEEDSFAKFVGAFDDEYGGRRGEWTFHAVHPNDSSSMASTSSEVFPISEPVDPFDSKAPKPRAEWESAGAGRYNIYPNGEVRALQSGHVWHLTKVNAREFELEQPDRRPFEPILPFDGDVPQNAPQPLILAPFAGYTLSSKLVHTESGGVKLPLSAYQDLRGRRDRRSRRSVAIRVRSSVVDVVGARTSGEPGHENEQTVRERQARLGSHDSTATATPHHRISQPTALSYQPTTPTPPLSSSPREFEPREKERRGSKNKRRDPHSQDLHHEDEKQKKSSFGDVFKRGFHKASSLVKEYEERKQSGTHIFSNGHGNSKPSPVRTVPSDRSDSASHSSRNASDATAESYEDEWPGDEAMFGSLGLGIEDEQNGGLPWTPGKAWEGVPDEALAMVIPIEADSPQPPMSSPTGGQPFINPFFLDGPRQALLVWFTPFNSTGDETIGSSSTLFKIPEHHENLSDHEHEGSSLRRLPKLLRPRKQHYSTHDSTKHIALPPPARTPPNDMFASDSNAGSLRDSMHRAPLPFKSFRVVAKVVNTEDLRSEPEVKVIALERWSEQVRTGKPGGSTMTPNDQASNAGCDNNSAHSNPSTTDLAAQHALSGRAFPAVIAVCHSHAAGVEFVLEGLDRLGLCKGESAWGPTGYEEWRGTGLSNSGRQLLDLLWAACAGIMGL